MCFSPLFKGVFDTHPRVKRVQFGYFLRILSRNASREGPKNCQIGPFLLIYSPPPPFRYPPPLKSPRMFHQRLTRTIFHLWGHFYSIPGHLHRSSRFNECNLTWRSLHVGTRASACSNVKRRTNVLQLACKMVWSFSFFLFTKGLYFKRSPGEKFWKSVKSVEKCEKVWKSAATISPFRFSLKCTTTVRREMVTYQLQNN